jgi:hypothetical protein
LELALNLDKRSVGGVEASRKDRGDVKNPAMLALPFLAVVGLVVVALLFVATSDRYGLKPSHPDAIRTLAAARAPAADVTSQAVFAAQAKIKPAAHEARAERQPTKKRVTHERQPVEYQQPFGGDRFSIKGY